MEQTRNERRATRITAVEAGEEIGHMIKVEGSDYLTVYHSSSDNYPESVIDFFVFTESFRYNELVDWQEELLNTAPYKAFIGHRSPSRFNAIHACSYHVPFTVPIIMALREAYGCIQDDGFDHMEAKYAEDTRRREGYLNSLCM